MDQSEAAITMEYIRRPIGRHHCYKSFLGISSATYTEAGPIGESVITIMNMHRPIGGHHSSKVSSAYPPPGTHAGPIRSRHFYNEYDHSSKVSSAYPLPVTEAGPIRNPHYYIEYMHPPIGGQHCFKSVPGISSAGYRGWTNQKPPFL